MWDKGAEVKAPGLATPSLIETLSGNFHHLGQLVKRQLPVTLGRGRIDLKNEFAIPATYFTPLRTFACQEELHYRFGAIRRCAVPCLKRLHPPYLL